MTNDVDQRLLEWCNIQPIIKCNQFKHVSDSNLTHIQVYPLFSLIVFVFSPNLFASSFILVLSSHPIQIHICLYFENRGNKRNHKNFNNSATCNICIYITLHAILQHVTMFRLSINISSCCSLEIMQFLNWWQKTMKIFCFLIFWVTLFI